MLDRSGGGAYAARRVLCTTAAVCGSMRPIRISAVMAAGQPGSCPLNDQHNYKCAYLLLDPMHPSRLCVPNGCLLECIAQSMLLLRQCQVQLPDTRTRTLVEISSPAHKTACAIVLSSRDATTPSISRQLASPSVGNIPQRMAGSIVHNSTNIVTPNAYRAPAAT